MSPRKNPAAGRSTEAAAAAPPTGPDGQPLTFEKALDRLEAIVGELEDGALSLEDSIARFEEGVALSRFLEGELGRAEKRVQELVEASGGGTRPWAGDDGDDDEPGDDPR